MTRLQQLQARIEDPFLVTAPVNVRYLTGFDSSNPALLVEPDRVRLFSDFRYAERGRQVEGVEFSVAKRNLFGDLAERLSGRIGFEADAVSYAGYETLAAGGLDLVPQRGVVEALRAVKDGDELALIRRAGEITSRAFEQLARERFVGRTERELAWRMDSLFHELGGGGPAYGTIVAAGGNGASPHAVPGDREIEQGTTVVIDAACTVDGYASDCTRTFATGELGPELARAYDVCLRAQTAGLSAVVPGVLGASVDAEARSLIQAEELGESFGHGLGHGLGLEVHEAPWLNPEKESMLAAGKVITIEPGIYLPGLGGIRIEDLVIVRDAGPEVLSGFSKELVVVG
jgi:Xaa-Pro aminopeptidase